MIETIISSLKNEIIWFIVSKANTPKRCPFHYRNWNAKVQEICGVTGKFGLGVQNEAGQRLIEFF